MSYGGLFLFGALDDLVHVVLRILAVLCKPHESFLRCLELPCRNQPSRRLRQKTEKTLEPSPILHLEAQLKSKPKPKPYTLAKDIVKSHIVKSNTTSILLTG